MERDVISEDALNRHYALLDILLLLFWFALTGEVIVILTGRDISLFNLIGGLLAASVVTLTAHEFVIRGEEREKNTLLDYLNSLKNLLTLFIDVTFKLIVANGVLVYQSLTLDIEPRIVRVKVNLTSESEVTLISLLITLVPGTLVIDAERFEDDYYLYVHYSYLKAENLIESMKETINKWDGRIKGVFK